MESRSHLAKLLGQSRSGKGGQKLSAQSAAELPGNHRDRMHYLSETKIRATLRKTARVHVFQRNIVERLLIESSGENSL